MKGQEYPMERSDEQLMQDYQNGDKDAMKSIFQGNKLRIINFCYGLLGNRADAEEAASDVFLAVVKYKDYYDSKRTFSTWIFTVARNQCINRIRKRNKTVSLWYAAEGNDGYEPWEIPDGGENSREILAENERAHHVRKAITRLPYEQREAIVLKQYHGFSYAEISNILNCSLDKVKVLIFRAKERLREELASLIGEELS